MTTQQQHIKSPGQIATPDVDVGVIYTYEDHFMPPLLSSLAESADDVAARLILIDNVSENGAEQWKPLFSPTQILRNERRLGYGPNLNRILAASTARYVLLLNTDMSFVPEENVLDKMVAFMDSHPACGVSGCRLYHTDHSYASPARRFLTMRMIAARRLAGVGRLFGDPAADLLYRDRDPESVFACDWLSGCLLMVRREAYEQVGGFDERFAKYFEDVDFCARMAAGGWSVLFNGGTFGYHHEQRASKRLFSKDAWLHLRSYVAWLRKWGFDPARTIERQRSEHRRAG